MNRIEQCFSKLAAARRAGLVTFITAGDPNATVTLAAMHALVRGGADLLELGVPFSDPMADGPTIQRASERALAGGMTLSGVLALVKAFRADDATTPIVLMGYLNPIERFGVDAFAAAAKEAGVDGVLTVDLPPEESAAAAPPLRAHGLAQIYLLAPTSSDERVIQVCAQATGFVYYVSVKGVTGGTSLATDELAARIALVKAHSSVPVGVGFGVRTPDAAAELACIADAVIVGSALVEIIERGASATQVASDLEAFTSQLRHAMDAVRSTTLGAAR